jgi:hypothetical protein
MTTGQQNHRFKTMLSSVIVSTKQLLVMYSISQLKWNKGKRTICWNVFPCRTEFNSKIIQFCQFTDSYENRTISLNWSQMVIKPFIFCARMEPCSMYPSNNTETSLETTPAWRCGCQIKTFPTWRYFFLAGTKQPLPRRRHSSGPFNILENARMRPFPIIRKHKGTRLCHRHGSY